MIDRGCHLIKGINNEYLNDKKAHLKILLETETNFVLKRFTFAYWMKRVKCNWDHIFTLEADFESRFNY